MIYYRFSHELMTDGKARKEDALYKVWRSVRGDCFISDVYLNRATSSLSAYERADRGLLTFQEILSKDGPFAFKSSKKGGHKRYKTIDGLFRAMSRVIPIV